MDGINLELGPSLSSWFMRLDHELTKGRKPVLLERNAKALSIISESDGKRIQADMSNIPLPSNSTEFVFVKDVFGSNRETPSRLASATTGPVGDFEKIASEIYRVCEPNGKVLILEDTTPKFAPKEEIEKIFEKAGFKKEKEYNGAYETSNLFANKRAAYSAFKTGKILEDLSYAVIFVKP